MARILIIDDDMSTSDFLRIYFIKKGYDADCVFNGEDALKFVDMHKPHIVLLDINLGNALSGLDILKDIKQRHQDIAVIMMTGIDDPESVEYARKLGASEYITKPFSLDYLEKEALPKILNTLL